LATWFSLWIRNYKTLHTIKTKPIVYARLESYTEEDVRIWFQKYHDILEELYITKGKNVLNMDESGACIGYPTGKHVIIPIEVKELYTASPENRKLVTIIETIYANSHEPLPPFVIASGKKIMNN
jgi:hypothetical protein